MVECKKRVAVRHPGTGMAHHRLNFFPHDRAEAVDGTSGTGRFALLKGALSEALGAVSQKLAAVGTEIRLCAVNIPAVESDHSLNGPGFPFNPRIFCGHAGFVEWRGLAFRDPIRIQPL
jgi:hypothetical protein